MNGSPRLVTPIGGTMPHLVICRCKRLVPTAPCGDCKRADNQRRNTSEAHAARASITGEQRARVYTRDHHQCVDCKTTEDLTLDHVEPLVEALKRGKTSYQDHELVTRCRSCNSSKGARAA